MYYAWRSPISLNRRRRQGGDEDAGELGDQLPQATFPTPEEFVLRVEVQEKISAACKTLDQGLREVIMLRFVHGLSLKEAGKRLGCSHETVRQREADALQKLRESPEVIALR